MNVAIRHLTIGILQIVAKLCERSIGMQRTYLGLTSQTLIYKYFLFTLPARREFFPVVFCYTDIFYKRT